MFAKILGRSALTGLGDLVHRRHDLPSRQPGDGKVHVILETASQGRSIAGFQLTTT